MAGDLVRLDDLLIEVRSADLRRFGALFADQVELEANIVFNGVGSWILRVPGAHGLAYFLKTPGVGVIVSDSTTGVILFSGPASSIKQVEDVDSNQPLDLEISGVTDEIYLQDRLVWTDPTVDLSNPENAAENVYYAVTDKAENIMHKAVSDNLGPTALTARKLSGLVMGTSGGRGATLTKEVRFPTVLEFLQELATGQSLGFRMRQSGTGVEFSTYATQDRNRAVRLATHNRRLKSTTVQLEPPGVTHAIVAATDDRAGYLEVDSTASVEAGAYWTRRIEKFVNGNMKGAAAEQLEEVGKIELDESGFNNIATQAVAVDHEQSIYGLDWNLGDVVTVEIDNQELQSQVTGFVLKADAKDGVRIGMLLGDATGFDVTRQIVSRISSVDQRVTALERVPPASEVGHTHAIADVIGLPAALADTGWLDVTFQNGWVNFDARKVQYRRRGNEVWLRGIAKSGTVGAVAAFTLPVGFRPASRVVVDNYFASPCNGGFAVIGVSGDGTVRVEGGSNVWVAFDSVRFLID